MTSQFILRTADYLFGNDVSTAGFSHGQSADEPAAAATPFDYPWQDEVWLRRRRLDLPERSPLAIYRLFPSAWRLDAQGQPLSWAALAAQLVPYVADLGFTHIELKDVSDAAMDGQFALFVDRCHEGGIGVILEWPPHNPVGNTDHIKRYLNGFHLDGLRLALNHPGRPGEMLFSAEELEDLLRMVVRDFPGVLLLSDPGPRAIAVGSEALQQALQYTLAWNTAWSSNTLAYLCEPPAARSAHHQQLITGLAHAFDQHYVLPLVDDESSEGRDTWLGRMPGDEWQRFANLRAGLGFMWAHPGKKLLGMGTEFAQGRGWLENHTLDWDLLGNAYHMGVFRMVADLNRIYVTEPALHLRDRSPASFAWVVGDDVKNSVFAFLRYGDEGMAPVLAVVNFTAQVHHGYRLGVPALGVWREILNSDSEFYGGSNVGNASGVRAEQIRSHGYPASLSLTLPPLATLLLRQGDWPS